MLILKRLAIWLFETSLEALLLAVVLVSLFGCDQHTYGKCIGVTSVWVGSMFFGTGYLFTTAIARAVSRGVSVWPYSVIALALFFIHFEILNHAAGGMYDAPKRIVLRLAGGCIVLACTFAGTLLLRHSTHATANSLEPNVNRTGGPGTLC
jgi:hypothetical protein